MNLIVYEYWSEWKVVGRFVRLSFVFVGGFLQLRIQPLTFSDCVVYLDALCEDCDSILEPP